MSIFLEKKDELNNAIDNLRDCFYGFDFLTKEGLSVLDIDSIDGLKIIAVEDGELIDYDDFVKKIRKSLFSEDDDIKKSNFDWDNLSDNYYDVSEKYESLKLLQEQVEGDLTGDQELDTVEIYDKESLNDLFLDYLASNNLIYEVHIDGETYFLLNSELEKKMGL